MMKLKNFKGEIILTITALIWGTAFVAQSMGMKYTKPFTFNGVRTVVVLALVQTEQPNQRIFRKPVILATLPYGLLC